MSFHWCCTKRPSRDAWGFPKTRKRERCSRALRAKPVRSPRRIPRRASPGAPRVTAWSSCGLLQRRLARGALSVGLGELAADGRELGAQPLHHVVVRAALAPGGQLVADTLQRASA